MILDHKNYKAALRAKEQDFPRHENSASRYVALIQVQKLKKQQAYYSLEKGNLIWGFYPRSALAFYNPSANRLKLTVRKLTVPGSGVPLRFIWC